MFIYTCIPCQLGKCNHNFISDINYLDSAFEVSVFQRCYIVCADQSSVMAVVDVRMPTESTALKFFLPMDPALSWLRQVKHSCRIGSYVSVRQHLIRRELV